MIVVEYHFFHLLNIIRTSNITDLLTGFTEGSQLAIDGITIIPQANADAEVQDNILITTVKGPLDTELVRSLGKIQFRCFTELPHNKIASITVFKKSMQTTPEAMEVVEQRARYQKEKIGKSIFVGFVAAPDLQDRAITTCLFREVYAKNEIPFEIFDNVEAANAWAKSSLNATAVTPEFPKLFPNRI